MKFRKKPVVIEAVPCSEVMAGIVPSWMDSVYCVDKEGVHISTLEGVMFAEPTDWIIRGVQGEVYPCKPMIFEQTYEKVE